MADAPWEPPLAGSEVDHLLGALERQRATFRWKADGRGRAGLSATVGASAMTLGGLLKHLARAEDQMWGPKLSGAPLTPPFDQHDWDGDTRWDFTSAADDPPEVLYASWDATISRSQERLDAALAAGGLDAPVRLAWGDDPANLRRLVLDLIDEYGRHTGHADLLREAVDGRVGEDAPWGWLPG